MDFDKKSVTLAWWAPSESNIKHYIIEMQETFLVPKDFGGDEEGAPQEEVPEKTEKEGNGTFLLCKIFRGQSTDPGKFFMVSSL